MHLRKGFLALMHESIQQQDGIQSNALLQPQRLSCLLRQHQTLGSAVAVLIIELGTKNHVGVEGLKLAQRLPGFAAVQGCGLLCLKEAQVCLHGASSYAPAYWHKAALVVSKPRRYKFNFCFRTYTSVKAVADTCLATANTWQPYSIYNKHSAAATSRSGTCLLAVLDADTLGNYSSHRVVTQRSQSGHSS